MDIYDVVSYAWRGRLLFNTDAEYRSLLGVTFETVRDRRADSAALEGYYSALNRECLSQCGQSLYAMVQMWREVSNPHIEWRERRQLASRKKFCRWLFRRDVAPLSRHEEQRFSPKECDEQLAALGLDNIFLMLITYKVVRALHISRGRDIVDDNSQAMLQLVAQLRDDMPQGSVLARPMAFDMVGEELKAPSSIAQKWAMLQRIKKACRAAYAPVEAFETKGLIMPGIWTDDTDRECFWVFPFNKHMAFRYRLCGGEWRLKAYEFAVSGNNTCVFVTTRGNEQLLAGKLLDDAEVAVATFEHDDNSITFSPAMERVPQWFVWRRFNLVADDAQYRRVLRRIYTSGTIEAMLFRNESAIITDTPDAMVGIDADYLYVWDAPMSPRTMRSDADGAFWYGLEPRLSLLNVQISQTHPLYIIPRNCQGPDRHFNEAVRLTELSHQVSIYHTDAYPQGLLCLNAFSTFLDLREAAGYGIRRVNSCFRIGGCDN